MSAVAAIPKAELHVHLEGTATPELVRRMARRNAIALPDGLFRPDGTFAWSGFLDFLRAYDAAAGTIRTARDYRDITYEYLAACAAEGAVYVELIASLDHGRKVGLDDAEHLAGIAQGIDDAYADHGIVGRIISSIVRNFGVADCEDVARRTVALAHPYVVGFNMAGDEAGFPAGDYTRAFAIAAGAGLGCSVHAGEHAGPESIRAALALPGVVRISHGVRAIEDQALVAELAERRIALEICPTSNVALGVFPSYERTTRWARCGPQVSRSPWDQTIRRTSGRRSAANTRWRMSAWAAAWRTSGRSPEPRCKRRLPTSRGW